MAVLVRHRRLLSLGERAHMAARLEEASGLGLPVDIRELTEDEPVFSFGVLRDGVRLYERERDARIAFEAATFSYYQDLAPLRAIARAGMRRRMRDEP